ncbi:MAG: deoxyhypusine synthase family protein [Pseudomonadota bacterium]
MPDIKDFTRQPVERIHVREMKSANDYLSAYCRLSFQARKLGEALGVLERMARDQDCFRVLTVAGALIPAGMGAVISDLIEAGVVNCIVSTGANVTHEVVEIAGGRHYIGSEHVDDMELQRLEINRIFDTFLPETEYLAAQVWCEARFNELPERRLTPSALMKYLGQAAREKNSVLATAARHNVPVFVPAFSDCELALNVASYNRGKNPERAIIMDEMGDLDVFAGYIEQRERRGSIILGGGVPRNWAQQVFPYLTSIHRDDGRRQEFLGYDYGVRITTDRPEFGGLSGCTFSESISWGKYTSQSATATVVCDITIALPLLAGALLERLGR